MNSVEHNGIRAFLFTDIEGSSRLWEEQPEQMRGAMARHDAILRSIVEGHRGVVVKPTGDGLHAAFVDPHDAIAAAVEIQRALAVPGSTGEVALSVRCGIHAGVVEQRDGDFFGSPVNRTARITSAAHGGQVLISEAMAALVRDRPPTGTALRDLGAARLRDLANAEHLYQLVHPDLRREFPALRSLEAIPNNLPLQLTSFIGRERELAEVRQILEKSRLVTLVGAGGIGKTRLSVQVAADVMQAFPDGVWFVELAALIDPRLLPQAVASVLRVKEQAGRPVVDALVKHLQDRCMLVILDNCEHLLLPCAELARALLNAGSQVKMLASSREPLHVAGEAIFALSPLAVPESSPSFEPQALEGYAAARLFVDRARAAQKAFRVHPENALAVAEVCRRLDGIPLALELAAARVRVFSVEQIASRLSDRFRLLTGGERTALPRQQTLRALIDWSYDLLSEAERKLFRRLAVFAGSFTLDAVESVACVDDREPMDGIDLLSGLVEKSLVLAEHESGRYRLLETVRQYAQEKLAHSGEAHTVRARHALYYLEFAETSLPELYGPRQGAWLNRFDLERENLLLVHAWCDHAEDGAALGLRLLHAVKPHLLTRGMPGLSLEIAHDALARPGAQVRDALRSRALFDAGWTCCFMGRYAEARPMLEEGLAIAREIGDEDRVAEILQPLGMAMLALGDREAARTTLEEALALARRRGERRDIAAALNALAQFHRVEGELDAAEPLYEQVVAIVRELGDRQSIAYGLLNLAMVYIGRGEAKRARAGVIEAERIAEEIGSRPACQSVLEVCVGLAAIEQDWAHSARFFGMAQAQCEATGIHRDPADEAFLMPHAGSAREHLGAAAFGQSGARGREVSSAEAMEEARAWLEAL